MSGERMTSPSERDLMKSVFDRAIRELEFCGLDRAQIGAAMMGIGQGIFAANRGYEKTANMITSMRQNLDQVFNSKH